MFRWLLGLLALAVLLAPTAAADTYTDNLVNTFNADNRVMADSHGTPPLTDPDKLNKKILADDLPLYIAGVAPEQTDITTPDALYAGLTKRLGSFSGVILVIDKKGYHVRAYNVTQQVANSVDPFMKESAKANKGNVYGAVNAFIDKLNTLHAKPGPTVAASPQTSTDTGHTSWTWLWWLLGILGGLAAGAWGLLTFAKTRTKRRKERESVDASIIETESRVTDLGTAVLDGEEVTAENMKASLALSDAKTARKKRDFNAARAHLATANSALNKAERKLNPVTTPDTEAVRATAPEDRKAAQVRATNPATGGSVLIQNTDYKRKRQKGYQHYYPGGERDGMYFYPGYYPYPIGSWGWDPMSVILLDAVLHDDHYDHEPARHDDYVTSEQSDVEVSPSGGDDNWRTTSDQSDTSFDGEDESRSDSGDYDFAGESTSSSSSSRSSSDDSYSSSRSSSSNDDSSSSYTPSTYTSPSTSSFDFGGGSSFGGGGDFGGGFSGGGDTSF